MTNFFESNPMAPFNFFFNNVWVFQFRILCRISPRYLASGILSIYWPLILKLRCLTLLDRDFILNNIISVLLALNDILLADSDDWCVYLSFLTIC